MTWNIHGTGRPDMKGIAGWIQLSGASVVLLQEVQQRQASQLAEILGWKLQWSMKHAPVVKPAEGLAILSPHPIALVAAPVLSEKAQRTSFRRRVAQIATVQMPRAAFQVCNVHLASGKSDERPGQVMRLMDHLAGVELLGGDFNDGPHSDTIANLLPMGFRRAESGTTAWSMRDGRQPTDTHHRSPVGTRHLETANCARVSSERGAGDPRTIRPSPGHHPPRRVTRRAGIHNAGRTTAQPLTELEATLSTK